ncbi:MAG: arginine--tRNA ligase, partial [Candidatus Hodarchaeota archaeon]
MDQFLEPVVVILSKCIKQALNLTIEHQDLIKTLETPINRELGDFSTNICFKLAKLSKKAPFKLAEEIMVILEQEAMDLSLIDRVEAKKGYLNFFLNTTRLAENIINQVLQSEKSWGRSASPSRQKVIVEHTSVNPTKPLHMGHLRNAVLGDTLARIFAIRGWQVEVQNLIDDLGKQVATMVWGFLNGINFDIPRPREMKYDVWCGLVYSEAENRLEANFTLHTEVEELMQRVHNDNELFNYLRYLAELCVNSNLETLWKVGNTYDLLVWESDISRSGLWKETLAILEKNEHFIY